MDDAGVPQASSLPHDLTEQAATDRYRTLFDAMDEGFCIIEFFDGPHGELSDYVHVEANAAYARHAGIENVVGQKLREMVAGEADDWIARYRPVLVTGRPIRFEQELVATGRHLELSAFRIEPPELKQVAVLFQDLTARKNAEKALQELNGTLEKRIAEALAERGILADIVEGTDALVLVSDMDFNLLAINSAAAAVFERLFGVHPKAGDNMLGLLADQPEHQEGVRAAWSRALGGEEYVEVGEGDGPDGERRFYEGRFSILRDADGEQVGAYQFIYDVTDRLAEQERLKTAEDGLRQAQKMEAMGQLTGGLAHDFNNLLGGISGSLELIEKRIAEGRLGEVAKYLSAAQGAAKRAAALTHRLLAFGRRQALAPEALDVNKQLVDFAELVRRTVGPEIDVRLSLAPDLWRVKVDGNQLENALLNLCLNARDAMPGGGRIEIATRNRAAADGDANDPDLPAREDMVVIAVRDTGSGIAPENLARVFEPFFTTKPLGEGTGLGLSMVHGFGHQSGGAVEISSTPGEGTCVRIVLPRFAGEVAASEVQAPGALSTDDHRHQTVLVIDDESIIRMLIVDALEEEGIRCLEAEAGAEGLDLLDAHPEIDLLVTDVGLPGGLNGRQVADRARETRPDLGVLFVTGYADRPEFEEAAESERTDLLTKPFMVDELKRRVDALLGPGRASSGT